jgi:2-dehydropantoate 2-reductase
VAAEHLRVAVLGPGAVGGLLAALLARAGSSVVVVAGDSTVQAIADRGLRVESRRFGNFEVKVDTSVRLQSLVDFCLITVKATQLDQALERVSDDTLAGALVVPFLNGIDHVEQLRRAYPSSTVAAATIRIEVEKVEAGLIRQMSPFAAIEMAPPASRRGKVEDLAAQLTAAGFDVRVREDEAAMLWDKLSLLAPLALLTTHARANVGEVRTSRREDALALISEVAAVARAEGAAGDAEAAVRLLDAAPPSMESSMQRDQAAGRPLELDAIGGTVLRRAARAGVSVPVTARLVGELRERTAGRR